MIKNYLLISLRNLLRHKSFSTINVLGLATGLACCLLILQYVHYELSYDKYNDKVDRIYRVRYDNWQNGRKTFECAAAVPAAGPALKNNFPEVQAFARLFPVSGVMQRKTPKGDLISFREEKLQIADPSVFKIFTLPLVRGDEDKVLEGANQVVISESAAKKYFKDTDPIGETITFWGTWDLEVTGVMKDVPDNSHIKFDFLISFSTILKQWGEDLETSWGWYDYNTYVLLDDQSKLNAVQEKWDDWLANERKAEWEKYNSKQAFILEPIADIHLYSNLLQESEPDEQGDGDMVYFLSLIAVFILIIAWVNYINLSTARAVDRANEVGVRKALGARRPQLMKQFMLESFILNGFASFIALLLVFISLPYFSDLTGRPLALSLTDQMWFWLTLLGLMVTGSLLSGIYPSLVLSSFQPVTVLKGKLRNTTRGILLRKGLVVFQFVASVLLIAGTMVVYQQINHMLNQDLGFNMEQTLVLRGPGVYEDSLYSNNFESFKNELLSEASISQVTSSSNVPGDEIFWTRGIKRLHGGPESYTTSYVVGMDYDYVDAYEIKVLAGRNFSRDFTSDREAAVIINKSASKVLEFESPEAAINEEVVFAGDTMKVVGVLDDYHQMSLKNIQQPMVFRLTPTNDSYYSIKVQTAGISSTLGRIQERWNQVFPGNPYEYFFLDEFFNRQYQSEQRFGRVFTIFSGLAIFIAGLGLFGLSSFTARQRTKEIGVRKVLGSSVKGIFVLLSGSFMKLVLVANLIAWPLCWLVMEQWLTLFPNRISISWWVFPLAGILVLLISIITVSYQTIRAATANPVDALKYE
ncbi:ABC transporter permease [Chondrinema litorale]|uniref:ABC transporter permease n=1 Tax=Chondrinema litorale TaxID=2994555 RepID=UPI0025449CED|nr:ABC transporter permease [Chondrinema litorale]UZR94921.1 ABC transporter permease [Chondrinema litorale]